MSGFLFVAPCTNPRLTGMNWPIPFALAFSYISTENLRRVRRNFSISNMGERSLA